MELKDFTEELFKQLNIQNIEEFKNLLTHACEKQDIMKNILEKYTQLQKDNTQDEDMIQSMFQFWAADRENYSQDFTPETLAELVAELTYTENENILDLCGGVGTLSVIHNKITKGTNHYIIKELDENVIPFLLFNLCLYNVSATVKNENVLTGECKREYNIKKGKKFGTIQKSVQKTITSPEITRVISNPPFNMKYDDPITVNKTIFKKLLNYAFIYKGLSEISNGKLAFILPNGVLSSSQEETYRKKVTPNIQAIINCPTHMFESTSIPVCVILFDTEKQNKITFVDARETYDVQLRLRKGEQSKKTKNKSHRMRTYKKNIAVFNKKTREKFTKTIQEHINEQGFSATIPLEKIEEQEYVLTPGRYVGFKQENIKTRPYNDIINDLNRIRKEKNVVKLTCNKVWLKQLGMEELIALINKGNDCTKSTNEFLEFMKLPLLEEEDWILKSNSKVLKFENKSKEQLSTIFRIILPIWKQHILYLNEQENLYLAELRDKLLPELMSGKLDVTEFEPSK